MKIEHVNLMRAGFKNTHNGSLWLYQKGEVAVGILREGEFDEEIIILVKGNKKEDVISMNELNALFF
ncbi:hypothetical protein [Adhaeribacter pallidiroseus]|uniref:Uncharacterized protein n=1 Tax=Adhaeribacter pallidiroseus TaxID=2072847 RepID=A0A369Q1V1_9BACT|nr:hypothetical protein [Adhaeribacter pallidiroseus]RDC58690.1 hypothetical protein AHMF7616_05324 [Adhaeribacter pallidiroseus]RDC58734.1 hypothetical protein AHMF7616_05368 [Adhaeribacter pallidiroseus]